ncbi:MAG: ABC-F family ATP-binding cassette domain-containing protein [Phycisphaeraceae bacterium]|nr:ABC-F family ATP-binding cassette domain-containing protein [Phycisphaeraceae bacterium]
MPVLSATNLRYTIGTRVLLDGVSFSLESGQKVGLVGRNGVGKTTLFRVLAGRLRPDSGSVVAQRGSRVGYLTQDPELNPDHTLLEEAAAGMTELRRLHRELDEVFRDLELTENAAGDMLQRLLKRQSDLQTRLDALGGYAVEHKVEQVLHGLGFVDEQFGLPVRGLSGGQKGRLALAKLLLESPDLLLLDEPTNHLDIAGREWLEEFLVNEFEGAVLLISHDRYLLDRVVDRIVEVESGRLIDYPGNYTAFTEIRKQRLLTQQRAYENQRSEWAKEEEFIRRFKAGQRAKEAQGRLSKLERQKELFAIDRPMEMASIRMILPDAPRSGDQVAVLRHASKWFDADGSSAVSTTNQGRLTLFHDLTLTISRGDRWGIIGPNGAGKSTLIKCLLGQAELSEGTVRVGANVVTGYFAQLPPDEDADLAVYQYLQTVIRRESPTQLLSEQQARDLAGMFLFSGAEQEKAIGSLSGGERSRARLAGLLASAKNLLVLDEPTNHLDIPSAERLEQSLRRADDGEGYQGTLLLISHDRALIDATCDHLLVFDGAGGVTVFHGNYSEYHRKQLEQARAADSAKVRPGSGHNDRAALPGDRGTATNPSKSTSKSAVSSSAGSVNPKPPTGLSWMPLERLERELAALERSLKDADRHLADPKVFSDPDRCRKALEERDQVANELERYETEWLYRSES